MAPASSHELSLLFSGFTQKKMPRLPLSLPYSMQNCPVNQKYAVMRRYLGREETRRVALGESYDEQRGPMTWFHDIERRHETVGGEKRVGTS